MKTYQIYSEGYMCSGMDLPAHAQLEGEVEAENWEDAVMTFFRSHFDDIDRYSHFTIGSPANKNLPHDPETNPVTFSIWGCRLYPSYEEADTFYTNKPRREGNTVYMPKEEFTRRDWKTLPSQPKKDEEPNPYTLRESKTPDEDGQLFMEIEAKILKYPSKQSKL